MLLFLKSRREQLSWQDAAWFHPTPGVQSDYTSSGPNTPFPRGLDHLQTEGQSGKQLLPITIGLSQQARANLSALCPSRTRATDDLGNHRNLTTIFLFPPLTFACPFLLLDAFPLFFFFIYFISWRLITLQYCSGLCHTLTWISHGFTCVPHPEPPSHLPPHPIPLGYPSAPAPSTCLMHPTWTGDLFHTWWYTCFDAVLSDHPTLAFSHRVQVCSIHLCLFSCLAYRVIVTIFLNSIYMC